MTKFPSLGSANSRQFTAEVKQILELWLGQRGTGRDKVLTVGDWVDLGVLDIRTVSGKVSVSGTSPGVVPSSGSGALPPVITPTGLTASGALGGVNLEWDAPSIDYYAYTEVLRSQTNLSGTAAVVARPIHNVHRDELWQGGVFYYWIRFVTSDGVTTRTSALNAAAGTQATVGTSSDFILSDVLTIPWKASTAYSDNGANPPDYVVPTPANRGSFWFFIDSGDAGTSGSTEPDWSTISAPGQTIADGTATWTSIAEGTFDVPFIIGEVNGTPVVVMDTAAYIADATITNLMVGDVNADKITTGDLVATLTINGGAIYGGVVGTSSGSGYRALMSGLDSYLLWGGTGTKNDANAVFYVKNDGDAKFAGELAAGSIITGDITLNTNGLIKSSGKTIGSGTGVFLGYSGSTYQLDVGDHDAEKFIYFDGTDLLIGLNSQIRGVSGYANDSIYLDEKFDSIDAWDSATSGAGSSVALSTNGYVELTAGAVSFASATLRRLWLYGVPPWSWTKERRFKCSILVPAFSAPGILYVGLGTNSVVNNKAVFRILNNALHARTGNTSSDTNTDLSTTLTASTTYELEIHFLPGVNVRYYLDGVLKATITTTLPSGSNSQEAISLGATQAISPSVAASLRVTEFKFEQAD